MSETRDKLDRLIEAVEALTRELARANARKDGRPIRVTSRGEKLSSGNPLQRR